MTLPSLGRPSRSVVSGVLLRLTATGLFAVMSLFVRLASAEAPIGQIIFHRSAWALIPVIGYLMLRGQFPAALKTRRPGGHFKRGLFGGLSMIFSFLSLAYLPLALATALGFIAPLLSVPLAMIMLRERPGVIVTLGALVGFGGICLMLASSFVGPAWALGTIIGVVAGLAGAGASVVTKVQVKTLIATEPAATIAFYFAALCALLGLATWPFGWADVSSAGFAWLVGSGLVGGLAHIAMTEAIARAPISTLAPFEFTAMLWALLFDMVCFALTPELISLGGAFLIVGAATMVAFAEPLEAALRRRGG